ncbi:1-acyl-sn-glycerol-3-phosphate acyltransferase [Geminocystis sp. NIES-3708]|uniref:lysophospholipid acyltransferase family protein n=1 Tax=Geminocystis sp. NIES-3708 TaxID=1615909 RepID=UPI0005FC4936|nr:lysophospholipid acyltransferase family protein [Geminocystis sp. NIES-3708]BAQ59799.1 1-acyl-sn-glycerol-3-phosphate acyltransferase [Geminocystis sp. NIES-3708]
MNQNQSSLKVKKTKTTVYHLVRSFVVNPVFHLYFRGTVAGREKIPSKGKLIIVSNHASVFDPPLLSAAITRPVSYMAKEELFQINGLTQIITALGAYPVNREGVDRKAIRQAISRIEEGWATGIFIEGTRTADGKIYDPKLGAALIAAKAQAPLLPVCLCGTEKISIPGKKMPQFVKIHVKIGDLIEPPISGKKEQLELVTNQCAQSINNLYETSS